VIPPRVPLGELCDVLDSQRKPITKRDRTSGEFPYYGATGILDYVAGYIFSEKLVLIGEDGAKWGPGENSAFVANGRYWVNNHAHVIRPHRHKVLDEWIIYYLNYSDLSSFVSGLTVPKLNQGRLREIPIPLPPLPEQLRIVAVLDEAFAGLATATANAEKNLKNARELFDSYLNGTFRQKGRGWVEKTLGVFVNSREDRNLRNRSFRLNRRMAMYV
jgi:type I restriction enzyme S subunit